MRAAGVPVRSLERETTGPRMSRLNLPRPRLPGMRDWRLLPKLATVMTVLALAPLALVITLNDVQTRERLIAVRRVDLQWAARDTAALIVNRIL